MRARHVDREPERDRRRARVLLEDLDLDAGRPRPSIVTRGAAGPAGSAPALDCNVRTISSGASPLTPSVRFALVYISSRELLHIVERDRR